MAQPTAPSRSGLCLLLAASVLMTSVFAASPSDPVEGVLDLTSKTFDSTINGSKPALVELYADWCGHCKKLHPVMEAVGAALQGSHAHLNDRVIVAKVDADNEKPLATRLNVHGFPTLKTFKRGSTEPQEYDGQRTSESMLKTLEWLVKQNPTGRVPELDALAKRAAGDGVLSAVEEAQSVAYKIGSDEAQAYARVLSNYKNKGSEWLNKESARIEKMVDDRSSSPSRLSGMLDKLLALKALQSYEDHHT